MRLPAAALQPVASCLVGDPFNVPAKDPNQKGPLLFNPNAYIQPQGLTFGNSGRNSLNLPYRTNFDMAVYKVFKPTERVDVQFRAEAFNIFNHPQWKQVNAFAFNTPGIFSCPAISFTRARRTILA